MVRHVETVRIVTPKIAVWLWKRPDSWLRRLALDGKLPYRWIRPSWGGGPVRGYSFDACCARWGAPDPDRLSLVESQVIDSYQIDSRGAVRWQILTAQPGVLDDVGGFARPFDRKDSE